LVTTASGFFTGPPPGQTLKELSGDIGSDFTALESRQSAIAARRVELLRRQAEVTKEMNGVLTDPADGLVRHTSSTLNNTKGAIWHGQKRGAWQYYSPPPKVQQLEKGNVLGGKVRELAALDKEIAAGHKEERLVLIALKNLNVGAVEGRGPRAGQVTNLATWRATYGSPTGKLALASPSWGTTKGGGGANGYATEWRPNPRVYGGPNSPLPHGHKRLSLFSSFSSSAVTMTLGRDLK
jgi:hypothetical protein